MALAAVACSNEKTAFSSKAIYALLSDRNSDGNTSDIEGNTIYVASDATVNPSDMDGSDAPDEDATAVSTTEDREVPEISEPPQQPTMRDEEAKSCADALGLNPAPKPSDFKFALVTKIKKNGKLGNANDQILFSDPASDHTKPLFLKG